MALPFPTLPLSQDPAGSLGEGLELGEEGCTSRTRIYFLLFCPSTPAPLFPWDTSLMSTLENGGVPDVGEGLG